MVIKYATLITIDVDYDSEKARMIESIVASLPPQKPLVHSRSVGKASLPWKLTLPEFEENETIVKHSKLVYKYRQIMKSADTCEYLILHNKADDTIRPDKLGDICYYIEEELRNGN